MTDKPTDTDQSTDTGDGKCCRRGCFGRCMTVMLVAALLAVVGVKFYVAPAMIAGGIERGLAERWQGPVEVGEVEFNFFSPIVVHGLVLRDELGDTWLAADAVRAEITGWSRLRPEVWKLDLDGAAVTVYAAKPLPLTAPADDEPSKLLDLRELLVGRANVTVIRADGRQCTFSNVDISASDRDGQWRVELQFDEADNSYTLAGRARLADGEDDSSVIHFVGQAKLPGGRADVAARIEPRPAQPNRRFAASANISADIFGGQANLAVGAVVPVDGPPLITGHVIAADMDLMPLTTAIRLARPSDGRLVLMQLELSLAGASLDGVSANGLIFLDDVMVHPDSILETILSTISPQAITQDRSDVQAVFSLAGPVVTVHKGSIGGELISLDIEPDGTIDLHTHELNGVVVAVIMKDISRVLSILPMLGVLSDSVDDLTRSRVTGTWDAPIIMPLPMGRLAGNMLGFVQAVASTRGQFGGLMFVSMEDIFDDLPPINGDMPDGD